jgi:simple sugar transport system ATP-binding protein
MVLSGPSEARSRGIGMVFQHFSLFDNLTVAENVALGLDGKESFKDMSARLQEVSNVYGLPLDPKREVWQLSVGERQRIEIVRALMQNPKFLILDEPTAVLTPQEADQLFVVLERLKAEGRAILYISHKLEEVKRLCDTATILRGGKKVSTCNPQMETAASLARMMVGADIKEVKAAAGRQTTVPRLVVNDLCLEPDDPHGVRLEHISLEVKGGEILGIAGVAGNGQSELLEALAGIRVLTSGEILLNGEPPPPDRQSPKGMRALGVSHVPEDRHRMGLVMPFQACESAMLGFQDDKVYGSGLLFNRAAIVADEAQKMESFDIRPRAPLLKTANFSGGNQQKIVLAREIERNPHVILVGQPTRGVDIGAIEFIHKRLVALRDAGKAVLVVSVELDEIMALSDRILVVCAGRITGERRPEDTNQQDLGLLMAGVSEHAA